MVVSPASRARCARSSAAIPDLFGDLGAVYRRSVALVAIAVGFKCAAIGSTHCRPGAANSIPDDYPSKLSHSA